MGRGRARRSALAGSLHGPFTCAECEGIVTLLELSPEGQYRLRELYSGRSETAFVSTGAFHWDASGEVITLDGMSPLRLYKVGAGRLWALDLAGQVIKGGLAERYVLTKAE